MYSDEMNSRAVLTCLDFNAANRCPKLFWLLKNRPEIASPQDEWSIHLRGESARVARLAQKLFPEGITIDNGKRSLAEMQAHRKIAMSIDFPALLAVPVINRQLGICCNLDILSQIEEDVWALNLVACSTKIKKEHLYSLAFQMCCLAGSKIAVQQINLLHINGNFTRQGEINPKELFSSVNVTKDVLDLLNDTKQQIEESHDLIDSSVMPDSDIGSCCKYPGKCQFYSYCHANVPVGSVYDLPNNRGQARELINMGFNMICDVPECLLRSAQHLAIKNCTILGSPLVDTTEVSSFVQGIHYPLYSLDFESFGGAIPLFAGLRPFQPLVFQFSLHKIDSIDGPEQHWEFIADDKDDPRERLLDELLSALGDSGTILVWNKSFESTALKRLAELFPEKASQISSVIDRIVDLIVPFRKGHVADINYRGSFSVKSVLPNLCGISYNDLSGVKNGTMASLVYYRYIAGMIPEEEWPAIRNSLSEYCGLDTLALIHIYRTMVEIVNISNKNNQLERSEA
jgi:hypothetical protein